MTASVRPPPLTPRAPGSPPPGLDPTHPKFGRGTRLSGRFLLLDVTPSRLHSLLRLLHSPSFRLTNFRRLDSEVANSLTLTLTPSEDRIIFESIHDLTLDSTYNSSDIRQFALLAPSHMTDILFAHGRFRNIHSLPMCSLIDPPVRLLS